ncbi:unnamed protein product [Closterium sp. NIES-64]|nr:unnamed protein product [Closterium sp. NIES-64]
MPARLLHLPARHSAPVNPPLQPDGPAPASPGRAASAAEPPVSRAALPPSRPGAEPPCTRAAQPPSSPGAEPPCARAAQQPSRPAPEPPFCIPTRPALLVSTVPLTLRALSLLLALRRCRRMATPSVLAFDAEGRAIDFEVWLDDLQLLLQCDRADDLSLFDLTSGASPAPAADAEPAVRSKWATRDAAATSCLTLATRAALPAEFCAKNPPPMYIALYYVVARLPDSLRVVRDHFLAVCPTTLSVDLLEKALLAAEKSIVAVGASRGDPRTPIFEGCSPSPLLPSVASAAAAADLLGLESVGAASAPSGRRRSSKGKGGKGAGGAGGGVAVAAVAAEGVGVAAGLVAGVVVVVAAAAETVVVVPAVVVEAAAEVEAAEVEAVEAAAEEAVVVEGVDLVGVVPSSVAAVVVASARSGSSSSALGTSLRLSSFVSGTLGVRGVGVLVPAPTFFVPATARVSSVGVPNATQRCFGRLTDAWRQQFPGASEIPRWDELLRAGVAIFDLDFDAILTAMYVVDYSEENEGYRCFQPDPGIGPAALGACEAAALGASASALSGTGETALSGTESSSSSLTFTLDSGASRSFFRDRTTLTPLGRPVAVSLADPSGGPVLSHFSTVLPCPGCPFGHPVGSVPSLVLYELGSPPGYSSLLPLPPDRGSPADASHGCVGPSPQSVGRVTKRYFLLVVDDYSRYTTVLPLRSKGAVTEVLIEWIREARLQLRKSFGSDFPVLRLHSDRGGEFSSRLLRDYCRARGIRQTFTLPDSPQQNGIAERRIGMVMDVAPLLWTGKVGDASVFRVWGSRAFVRDLSADKLSPRAAPCVFLGFPTDAPGWQFYHPSSRRVLSSQDVTFDESNPLPPQVPAPSGVSQVDAVDPVEPVGATAGGAGLRVLLRRVRSLGVLSRGVLWPGGAGSGGARSELLSLGVLSWELLRLGPLSPLELREWFAFATGGVLLSLEVLLELGLELLRPSRVRVLPVPELLDLRVLLELELPEGVGAEPTAVGPAAGGVGGTGAVAEGAGAVPAESGAAARPRPYFVPLLRSRTLFVLPVLLSRVYLLLSSLTPLLSPLLRLLLVAELVDFAARCRLDYAASLVAESASVCPPSGGGTYVDAVPPPGANIVSGMWIFRVKRPPGLSTCLQGTMTTLRVLLHIAAQRDYELHSLDFSTAFLQGSLHEEIWLRRPPGFTGTFPPGTQWSLRRPVYGLRQAPREWHDTLRTTLAALGFAPSTADPSLFLRTDTSLPPFYILVYVDDLVFATADTAGLAYVKSELLKRHTCTDLGELRSYLGLQITRDRARRTITLTQSHMVQQVLQRFGFTYSSPQATPLPTRHSLSALPSDESVESSGPYAELVGCLMYLMTCTRPDLAYPLSILARYVAPGRHRPEHMAAAKRVLRYLCSTSGMGLVLGGRSPVVLTGHADASWADDQANAAVVTGLHLQPWFRLCLVAVYSHRLRFLGSSCEAEIYAGAMAAQELRWLTYLLTDLGEPPRSPPVLYVDNKAMLALCREQRLEHRTKHIALRYFLARELQQRGQLRLAYVASEANTADVFTKARRAL